MVFVLKVKVKKIDEETDNYNLIGQLVNQYAE